MHSCILTTVFLMLAAGHEFAQAQTPKVQTRKEAPDEADALPKWKPPKKPDAVRSDIARYSPLAAAGGYQGNSRTWYDALFERLNPKGIDYGALWEQRKETFRQNVLFNRYFWSCAFLTLWSAFCMFGWHVAWCDRRIVLEECERQVRMLMTEADYFRENGAEAIRRYNEHIEKCNLVAESLESGMPAPEMSGYAELKQKFDKVMAERQDMVMESTRHLADMEQARISSQALITRIQELERQAQMPAAQPEVKSNPALVDRINRLEDELRLSREEIGRLKGTKRNTAKESYN